MEVRNCRNCRRLFNYIGGQQICPDCKEKLEKKFYQVKEYIRENAHAGLKQISKECDVSQQQLQQWLEFSSDSDIAMQCERCGAKIYTGRFCDNCKGKMAQGLSEAFKSGKSDKQGGSDKPAGQSRGMRFIKK